ncbi:hypothetical protein GS518_13785 [Leptospira interrogans]|nr:hypothetical protein [Leptospira interrogans serovar Copenhageni]QHH29316.1 hypothetical protein GS520_13785 [Leptospira interrogans]QHH32968.1 hypothetical protein GS525_13805 [Leptospira interrogans]QHH36590.1 hypothetical protein GS519_13775 [Leptospira interrogans]QHH40234.1 hypothetical protein GS526_13785 [Leptospira interrogans]
MVSCTFKSCYSRIRVVSELEFVGTSIKYKKNHRPSDFCAKSLFCGHY